MKEKQSQERGPRANRNAPIRASISFPPDLYKTLEELAKQKKVSLAWVVREASEMYIKSEVEQSKESGRR